jgi:hypothetical protein
MDVQVMVKESAAFNAQTASTSTAKATFSLCEGAKIVAAGILVRGNDAGGANVSFSLASAGASITASGNVAEIIIPASNSMGKIIYSDLDDLSVEVGAAQEIQVHVTAEGVSSLSLVAFVKYTVIDELLQNVSAAVLTA